jgi:hypothetical protein
MAAFKSFLILDRRGEAGASDELEVEDHRRLEAAALRMQLEHATRAERKSGAGVRVAAMSIDLIMK